MLDYSTDANGAVGLGNANLFQSFIICSEHKETNQNGVKTFSTKLTYGKIAAGKLGLSIINFSMVFFWRG